LFVAGDLVGEAATVPAGDEGDLACFGSLGCDTGLIVAYFVGLAAGVLFVIPEGKERKQMWLLTRS